MLVKCGGSGVRGRRQVHLTCPPHPSSLHWRFLCAVRDESHILHPGFKASKLHYGIKKFSLVKRGSSRQLFQILYPESTSHGPNVSQIIEYVVSPVVSFGVDVLRADYTLTWHYCWTPSWMTMTYTKVWCRPALFTFLIFSLMDEPPHLYWDFSEF